MARSSVVQAAPALHPGVRARPLLGSGVVLRAERLEVGAHRLQARAQLGEAHRYAANGQAQGTEQFRAEVTTKSAPSSIPLLSA